DQLSVVRSETELAKMGVLIKKDLGGVPVTYKKKFEGAGFLRDLVLAVDAVHLAGQHGMDGMKDFLEKFRPRVVESNLNLESIARIAELKKVLAKRWLEYRRIFVEKFPGFQESWVCKHVDPCIKGLSEPKYSFRHMAQEGDLGSNARHDVYGYINIICQNIDPNHVVKCNNQAPEARRVPAAILSNPEFMKLLAGMSREFSSMHNMVNLLRLASKKMERDVFDLSQRMKNVTEYPETEAASVKLELCPNLWVEGDILTTLLLRQPFTNAAKSVRDSPKKEVVVSTQKIKLGELKEGMETVHHRKEAYEYLKSLRLGDEDIVYRMQVRDTGVGIPPENMARIFEDGFSTFGTIGFGLWFLDQRIGNYKGTYDVESKVGVGTTFNLYFKPSKPPKELRGLLKS
ncbi:MAG: sensor histidine kinase, partial [Candidatus Altiarchaeales archaeon]|nr:sensor histidine kinase [Candidatus Altiarchaeales archaeon]